MWHGAFRPRHGPLCVHVAEVETHDDEALEPQPGLFSNKISATCHQTMRGPWFAPHSVCGSNALVLLQDPLAIVNLEHLVLIRLLDGVLVAGFSRHHGHDLASTNGRNGFGIIAESEHERRRLVCRHGELT